MISLIVQIDLQQHVRQARIVVISKYKSFQGIPTVNTEQPLIFDSLVIPILPEVLSPDSKLQDEIMHGFVKINKDYSNEDLLSILLIQKIFQHLILSIPSRLLVSSSKILPHIDHNEFVPIPLVLLSMNESILLHLQLSLVKYLLKVNDVPLLPIISPLEQILLPLKLLDSIPVPLLLIFLISKIICMFELFLKPPSNLGGFS